MGLLVGSDPELFLWDSKNNEYASAHIFADELGDKTSPKAVTGGKVHVDGLALEINPDPADNEKDFMTNIYRTVASLRELIPEQYELKWTSTARFQTERMKLIPFSHLRLGCEPDFNAYTRTVNPSPSAVGENFNLRTAGGHIHVGWTRDKDLFDPNHFKTCCEIVKYLDYYVGLKANSYDSSEERRKLYGRAGSFRPKPYGLEYRTPSNVWASSMIYQRVIFRAVREAVKAAMTQRKLHPSIESHVFKQLGEPHGYESKELVFA